MTFGCWGAAAGIVRAQRSTLRAKSDHSQLSAVDDRRGRPMRLISQWSSRPGATQVGMSETLGTRHLPRSKDAFYPQRSGVLPAFRGKVTTVCAFEIANGVSVRSEICDSPGLTTDACMILRFGLSW